MKRVAGALPAVIALISFAACSAPVDGREFRDFERMRRQQRYSPYDVSHYFANGAVMQPPPAHTLSREDAAIVPPPTNDTILARGAQQYAISCAPCHGAGGFGGGPIAPNLVEARPTSLRSAAILSQTPEALFAVVTEGKGRMPPLGWQLTPAQRWAVIAYVKTHASSSANSPAERADSAMADYLHHLDSLHASGTPIESIAVLKRPVDSTR